MRRLVVIVVAVLHLLLLDAVTKELAIVHLKGTHGRTILSGFFDLTYVENRGCAWGLFQGQVWPLALFGLLALAVLIWKRRAVFGLDEKGGRLRAGLWTERLLYAGILGNLIDRVFRGGVVDFFHFHWAEVYHFPCFNFADIYICMAAGILMLLAFTTPSANRGEKAAE